VSPRPRRRLLAAITAAGLAAGLALGLSASAFAARPAEPTNATLVLDFLPNAVHAGIFRAQAAGYYRTNNINLRIIQPTSTSDTLKLIAGNRADFGIADGIDLANQIDNGLDAQAIMALVQRPLGGLITLQKDRITNPRQLEGRTVGVTGVPSDDAILTTIVRSAGGNPARVRKVNIGFNGVQNLAGGRIQAFTGFWPADGTQLVVDGLPTRYFKLDEFGGPRYPGLVVFSTRPRIARDAALMDAFVDATVRGYRDTIRNPRRSLNDFLAQNRTAKRDITTAQLTAFLPLFGPAASYGRMSFVQLRRLSTFLVRNELIKKPIAPTRYGTNRFL
jgi:NitT/TauT family transport system substrate-binding protein/putative hydroxymethylpyrimidine transport system substrate-binding protein